MSTRSQSAAAPLNADTLRAPRLVALATALPVHRVNQEEAKVFAAGRFRNALGSGAERLLEVFDHSGIETRQVAMPLEWYETPHGFRETNDLYVSHALALAAEAALRALGSAGLSPRDIDHIVFVSSTGISTPSIDARLANHLGMRADVRRTPIWGLGCAGGVAGLSRAADFARAAPRARVLMIAVELCSLTFQPGDLDRRNLVATSLFADGAAAVVVAGAAVEAAPTNGREPDRFRPASREPVRRPMPPIQVLGSRSTLWPETLDMMGWTIDEHGLHVVFSRDIPSFVRLEVKPDLESFLADQGLALEDVSHLVAHPGGPKVLAAYAEALGLPASAFRHAAEVLRRCGNMSSPTCLFVLERLLLSGDLHAGENAVLAALGPGFTAEYLLMRAV